MDRDIVLIVSANGQQRQKWHKAVQRIGRVPLPAATVGEALHLLREVRPALILCGAVPEGCTATLLSALHGEGPHRAVPMIVHGALTPTEHRQIACDPAALVIPPRRRADDVDSGMLAQVLGRTDEEYARP